MTLKVFSSNASAIRCRTFEVVRSENCARLTTTGWVKWQFWRWQNLSDYVGRILWRCRDELPFRCILAVEKIWALAAMGWWSIL